MKSLTAHEPKIYPAKIFREYDIRGVAGKEIDEAFARFLGQAFAQTLKEQLDSESRTRALTVGVAHDCRTSSVPLSQNLIEGLRSAGVNVIDAGRGPSPLLYFLVHQRSLDGGIMVTASHNPADQNGFKMMLGRTRFNGSNVRETLRLRIEQLSNSPLDAETDRSGLVRGTYEQYDVESSYVNDLIQRSISRVGPRKLRLVVDGRNGVGGPVGVQVLRGLGCEVIELFTDPDGTFPNHDPDPTVAENISELRARVRSEKADFGIGWDGDADRLGVVDENGELVLGDLLTAIFGRTLAKEVPSPTVVSDVKCSEAMYEDLRKHGVNTVIWKTGLIMGKMQEIGAEFAGEVSGHFFFQHRYFGYDDGIHAAARLVEIVSNTEGKFSSLFDGLKQMFSSPEIRIACPESIKFEIAERAKTLFPEFECVTIDGVRVKFPHGWALVRASNTEAALSMRFEAESQEYLEEYQRLVNERIDRVKAELNP